MSKLVHKISENAQSHPFFTFEFFPPRTNQGFENLTSRISRLARLKPSAISITWGAGGSTKDRSLELAGLTSQEGLETILHLTCTNMEQGLVDEVLKRAKDSGIRNILALRGDPPRGEEEWVASDSRFTRAADLVSYIRSVPEYSDWFCIGVAGYPDGHVESLVDEDAQIDRLKEKLDAGADFIITQLFYDADHFIEWYNKLRSKGSIKVPIIPGVMPIQTYGSFARVTKLCGTRVPDAISNALADISHDDQLIKDYGVNLAVETITKIRQQTDINGFHFCTLNLEKSVQRILETLDWVGNAPSTQTQNRLIVDPPETPRHPLPGGNVGKLLITALNAATSATNTLRTTIPEEGGRVEINNVATWDDFPNGRFGDYKSPAFGNQNLWGGSSITRNEALVQWGNPKRLEDLTQLFLGHLHGKIPTTPFWPTPLFPESLLVLKHLERLTSRGWWTVGSQPAVDGASSSDEIFGWGPKGGYVFQKGFVEFFCEEEDVDAIEKRILEKGSGWVHFFAGNNQGKCRTSVADGGRNAVTWGVFPGQEIIQTTIIERESFLSWKEEAFSIWNEWSSFYRPGSKERELLEFVRDNRWLVSVIHHDYKDADALWTFLFDDEDAK